MFRQSYNRALLRLRLTTVTPLLVRAGDTGLSPTAADLACVRTTHGLHGRTVYVPGSSLKGVTRQAAEASVRGQSPGGVKGACDPLDHERGSCWSELKGERTKLSSAETYARLCLACRTFGSLAVKGRTSVRDLFPWDDRDAATLSASEDNRAHANRTELRHGVAIDRMKASVKHGPFDQEVVPAGVHFWGEVALENYQMWQLGFVVQAVETLDAGFARLGSSTTRGLGEVRAIIESITHEQVAGRGARPLGVGALARNEELNAYKLFTEAPLDVTDTAVRRGLSERFTVTDATRVAAWQARALEALGALS